MSANLNDADLSTARVFSSLTSIATSKWNRILDENTRVKDFSIDPKMLKILKIQDFPAQC